MRRLLSICILLFLVCCGCLAAAEPHTIQLNDTTKRVEYLDERGNLTSGPDGYAYNIQTLDDAEKPIREFYFDSDGKPYAVQSGYYGVARTYNEKNQCVEMVYLNAAGEPMLNTSGYAILKRTYDEAGRAVRDMYFDVQGAPIALWGGQYGIRRNAFDAHGHCIDYTYLDREENPMALTAGYATVRCNYNEAGKVEINRYYDMEGKPAKLSIGQYGDHHSYNEEGKEIAVTYLGKDGQSIVTTAGYTTVKKEYENGQVSVEWYYDLDGQPMALRRGQWGAKYVYQDGKLERKVLVDHDGNELFFLDQYLPQHPEMIILGAAVVMLAAIYLPKKSRCVIVALYVLFILYMTLYVRESSGSAPVSFELFRSYRLFRTEADTRAQIVNNILLFLPLGFVLWLIWPRSAVIIAVILFSVLIEGTQMITRLGWCEIDDVVSNGLGGGVGILLAIAVRKIWKNRIKGYSEK